MLSCVFTQAVFGMKKEEEEADLAGRADGAIIAARISLLPFVKGKRLPRGGVTTSLSDTQRRRRKASGGGEFFSPRPLLS